MTNDSKIFWAKAFDSGKKQIALKFYFIFNLKRDVKYDKQSVV